MTGPVKRKSLFNESQTTPVKKGTIVPSGHILMSGKWRGSQIISFLQGSLQILYEDQLGVVDFHPSADTAVIYIGEADLVSGQMYRRKVVKLRKVEKVRGIVMVEKTQSTSQYFGELQNFVAITLGMIVIPVTSQEEAAKILIQMVHLENRPSLNPFRVKRKPLIIDKSVLATVQTIPKLGNVKARALLEKFHSLLGISSASIEELTDVVGKSSAVNVRKFFDEPP